MRMAVEGNVALFLPRPLIEERTGQLDALQMPMRQVQPHPAEVRHPVVRGVRAAEVVVAAHIQHLRIRVAAADEVFRLCEIIHAVAQKEVSVDFPRHLPCFFQHPPQSAFLAVNVGQHQCAHHSCSPFIISSIFSHARARWLIWFFSSSVTSAKVLFSGS